MFIKKQLLTIVLFSSFLFSQNSIGVNINSDDVEVNGAYKLNSVLGYNDSINYMLNLSYLYNGDRNDLMTVGLNGESSLESAPGLIFGFGFDAVYADDFMALPLFGKLRYILPFDSDIPTTSLFVSYAYAPSALTFSDGEIYSNLKLEANIEIIPSIHVFTGYRNIDTDYEYKDYELNDSFYGGLKLTF